MADDQVALAAVAGAHGIAGEVRLKLFAQGPESVKRHKQVRAGERILTLTRCAAPSSPSPAPRCRRSGRTNIITPT
jgi:16S rRNA processing protein RimM